MSDSASHIQLDRWTDAPGAVLALNDPERRNALGDAMFTDLRRALRQLHSDPPVTLILQGRGKAFCAGFDLGAVVEQQSRFAAYVRELSDIIRQLRRSSMIVIGAVHGSALAGGCALVAACDLVVVSRETRLGYPVHRIGATPAVTIPALQQVVGPGRARHLLMGGDLIDGAEAVRRGLADHLVETDDDVAPRAEQLARRVAGHGRHALAVTKAWLNELDGSDQDAPFDRVTEGSLDACTGPEAVRMLRAFWARRSGRGSG
mgnify:CR=1 FL=1